MITFQAKKSLKNLLRVFLPRYAFLARCEVLLFALNVFMGSWGAAKGCLCPHLLFLAFLVSLLSSIARFFA